MIKNLNISKTVLTVLLFAVSSCLLGPTCSYQAKYSGNNGYGHDEESIPSDESTGETEQHGRTHTYQLTLNTGLGHIAKQLNKNDNITTIQTEVFDKLQAMVQNTQQRLQDVLEAIKDVPNEEGRKKQHKELIKALQREQQEYDQTCKNLQKMHKEIGDLNTIINSKDKKIGSLQVEFKQKKGELEELQNKLDQNPDDKKLPGKIQSKEKEIEQIKNKIASVWDDLQKGLSTKSESKIRTFFSDGFRKMKDMFSKKSNDEEVLNDAKEAENYFSEAKKKLLKQFDELQNRRDQTDKFANFILNPKKDNKKDGQHYQSIRDELENTRGQLSQEQIKNQKLVEEIHKLKNRRSRSRSLPVTNGSSSTSIPQQIGLTGAGMVLGGLGMYTANSLTQDSTQQQKKEKRKTQNNNQQNSNQSEVEEDLFDMMEGDE